MKAFRFTGSGHTEVSEVVEPVTGGRDVLIQIEAVGICHTDLDILHGRYPADFPRIPGHEFAGTIIAVGTEISPSRIGERVAVDPLIPCQACRNCTRGSTNLCSTLRAYGADLDGGIAERVSVNSANAHSIGDMDASLAALAEPVGCVVNALERANPTINDRVLVIGAGPMGMLLGVVLYGFGVRDLTIVDVVRKRLRRAADFGYTSTIHSQGDLISEAGPRAFDLVIDATGRPEVVQTAVGLLADGGTLVPFGVCPPGSQLVVDPNEVYSRQLKIIGSFSLASTIPRALEIIRDSPLSLADLVTHRFSLAEAKEALAVVGSPESLKIQIIPSQTDSRKGELNAQL